MIGLAKTDDTENATIWSKLFGRKGNSLLAPQPDPPAFRSARAPDDDDGNAADDTEPVGDFFSTGFGLKRRAFTLLPDPDFLYWSPGHKRAYSVLEYGIMTRAPITVITGDVGAGKTTLLQALLERVSDDTIVGLISNAHGNRGDLLRWALSALDVPSPREANYVETFQILQNFLVENYASGKYAILVIDEAQQLSPEGLEELRMLTNINTRTDELLQLVLIGQPELREVISRPEMRQFAQRIMASFHLGPMDADTTSAYIRHRLEHAGGSGDQITDSAAALVYKHTGGIPRLINKLCDFAIVYAATAEQTVIDKTIVQSVMNDGLLQGVTSDSPDEG
ncbi:ExeA family protein [Yoonia sp. R2331]|uniref:ExeA family protein n=1 Tax=Yoonia sp. R2331 TaxID=3237238 RepID=UPI0034E509C3